MKNDPGPPPQDTPFTVQKYVTDPKLVGYQMLTNYESTYWAPLVGNDAWRLYEVLRSFCHEGNSACYPSIRLLTALLGLKEKRVLTGWSKTVAGKEYRYVGLIEILQQYELAIAEVQGEGPKMRYIFHVNLTPGLLTENQLHKLPDLLQKKHGDLLERCDQMKRELQSKKRLSKFSETSKPDEDEAILQGGGKLPPRGGNLPGGGGNLPPKQHQYNNTYKTVNNTSKGINNNRGDELSSKPDVVVANQPVSLSDSLEETPQERTAKIEKQRSSEQHPPSPSSDAPPSLVVEHHQAGASALIAVGIAPKVAHRLAERHSLKRIEEKLAYLDFLQAEQPEKVKNPRGWLRRAIEENYGPPDGFISPAERAQREAQQAQRAEEEQVRLQQLDQAHRQAQTARDRQKQAYRDQLSQVYGTTAADFAFWAQALYVLGFAFTHNKSTFDAHLKGAEILKVSEDEVWLGFLTEGLLKPLTHPGTKKLLERESTQVAGRKVRVQYEVIPAGEHRFGIE